MSSGVDWIVEINASAQGCTAELRVNDFPLTLLSLTGASNVSIPINQYLERDRPNRITFIVEPGPTPSRAMEQRNRSVPDEVSATWAVSATVFARRTGPMADPDEMPDVLADVHWSWSTLREPRLPIIVDTAFSHPVPLGLVEWAYCSPLKFSPALLEQATTYVESIRKMLQAREFNRFVSTEARAKFAATARAYGQDINARMATFERIMEAEPPEHWTLTPLSPKTMDWRLVADGRLLECIGPDWEATLRTDDNQTHIDLLLGMIDGRLQIVK